MSNALNNVWVITLFVEDVPSAKSFYKGVFELEVVYEDDVSADLKLENLMINLLQVSEAHGLIEPAKVAGPEPGSRFMFTILVDDTDAVCAEVRKRGVTLINGPVDRPWGKRTAAFADPAGHLWEIAQDIP